MSASSPAATPTAGSIWNGHVKPAEVQIIVIVLVAGLFNAFFLVLSLRLLFRRYQQPGAAARPPIITSIPPDVECNLRRVTPMLVRQPDDELVYGLKQVLVQDIVPKPL